MLSSDYLEVGFAQSSSNSVVPSLFKVPSSGSVTCSKLVTASNTETSVDSCTVSVSAGYIQSVRATSFCSPSGCSSGEAFSLVLKGVELPGIAQDVPTYITVKSQTSETIAIGEGSLTSTVAIQPNVFTNPSIVAVVEGSCKAEIYHTCTLRFTLTTKNPFSSSGHLEVTLPTSNTEVSYLGVLGGAVCQNAQISGSSTGVSCSLSGNVATLSHTFTDASLTDDKEIILDVTNVLLPTSTRPTATFLIRSMLNTYEIDRIDTLTFSASPGAVTSVGVTRSLQKINLAADYVFSFTTTNAIDSNYQASTSPAYSDAA